VTDPRSPLATLHESLARVQALADYGHDHGSFTLLSLFRYEGEFTESLRVTGSSYPIGVVIAVILLSET
jgi:hypothetical protein